MQKEQSYQKGSIRKRGKKYYYRFRAEAPDGSIKLLEFPGSESKRETAAMLQKALSDYNDHGKIFDSRGITLNELMDEWYAVEIEPSSRASTTRDSYRNVMDHIRSHSIGKTKLKEISIEALQAYIDEKYYGEYDESGNEIKHAYFRKHYEGRICRTERYFQIRGISERISQVQSDGSCKEAQEAGSC